MLFYLLIVLVVFLAGASLIVLLQDFLVFPALLFRSKPVPKLNYLKIKMEDGTAMEIAKVGAGAGRLPILCLHGNGETNASFSDIQLKLASFGFHVYQFDYRGVGNSSGWPSENALYRDAEAVLEFVAKEHKCAVDRIILVGQSIGSGPATYLAEKYNTCKIILYAPFTGLKDVLRLMPFLRRLAPFLRYSFPNRERLQNWARKAGNGELILVHGRWDELVPFFHSEEIVKSVEAVANTSKRIVCIDHELAGHNDIIESTWNEVSAVLKTQSL